MRELNILPLVRKSKNGKNNKNYLKVVLNNMQTMMELNIQPLVRKSKNGNNNKNYLKVVVF